LILAVLGPLLTRESERIYELLARLAKKKEVAIEEEVEE